MKKVLVICARRYNGHELWTLLKRLRVHDHSFEVTSSNTLIRDELTLQPNTINRTFYQVSHQEVKSFDGISIVSGNMQDTEAYWADEKIISLLKEFRRQDKVVSAICCSVPTLAPICKGIRVSPFPLVRSKQRLLQHGAIIEPVSICIDQNTITAENQMMSHLWGDCISATLSNREVPLKFKPSKYSDRFRGKTPRRLPKDLETHLKKFRETPKSRAKD